MSLTTPAVRTLRAATVGLSFILALELNDWGSANMGSQQVVLLYVSIYVTDISQWMAKMCWRSRAQTALLQPKAQFPAVFEEHLKRIPSGLCLQDFLGNIWTCQTVSYRTNMHINGRLSLMSTMDWTMLILLCLLLVFVSTFNTISSKLRLMCDEHLWEKQYISVCW